MLTYADRLHEALVRVRVNLLPKLAPGPALCLMPYALCLMPYASGQPSTKAGSRSCLMSYALCLMSYALCLGSTLYQRWLKVKASKVPRCSGHKGPVLCLVHYALCLMSCDLWLVYGGCRCSRTRSSPRPLSTCGRRASFMVRDSA